MPDLTKIKAGLSRIEALERELNLKQLQINRLLNITQAINNNVSAEGLFNMYRSFLSWEVGIKKMVLFIKKGENWVSATSIGIDDELFTEDIPAHFHLFPAHPRDEYRIRFCFYEIGQRFSNLRRLSQGLRSEDN